LPPAQASTKCDPPFTLAAQIAARPTPENLKRLGDWFGERKQFDCAAQAFSQASQLDPSSATLAYLWGLSLSSAGDDSAALAPLRQAATLDPSDIHAHLASAIALDKMKRVSEAKEEWRKALALDPNFATALDGLSRDLIDQKDYASVIAVLARPSATGQLSPVQSLNLGIAYAGEGRLDEATQVLRNGLNTTPDSLEIADELAVVLMLKGRDHEAYSIFEIAIQKHPDDEATKVLYLHTLVTSKAENAASYARQLLATYPNQWEVLYLNGVLSAAGGEFQQARTNFQSSVSLNPIYGESRTALGNVLAHLGDPRGAREQLEKGIALGDDSPEAEYSLATVLRSLGETDAARQALNRYQELKSSRANKAQAAGKAESGDQSMAAGNYSQAAEIYRDALTTDPAEAVLHYKLSRALGKMNDVAGEINELQRTIELDPKLAEAQNQLGFLAVHRGEAERAESYFRAATEADPSYVVAWVNLAATLASEAKWSEADLAAKRLLEIDPGNSAAREIETAVAQSHSQPAP
jgi:tetratricopeptide (TPR) repeat protein